MNIQDRNLECVTMPPFVEILFSLPQSDEKDLQRLLPGFIYFTGHANAVGRRSFAAGSVDPLGPAWVCYIQPVYVEPAKLLSGSRQPLLHIGAVHLKSILKGVCPTS